MRMIRGIAAGCASSLTILAAGASLAAPPSGFQGVWKTHWDGAGGYNAGDRRMVIVQSTTDPAELDGMWDGPGYNGVLTGHLKGAVWSGDWTIPGGASGKFSFTLGRGSWAGNWTRGADSAKWYSTGKIASIP
jgi:hypothetical protein